MIPGWIGEVVGFVGGGRDQSRVTKVEVHEVYSQLPVGAVVEQPDGTRLYGAQADGQEGGASPPPLPPPNTYMCCVSDACCRPAVRQPCGSGQAS